MHRLATFSSAVEAYQLAEFLIQSGIAATVVGWSDPLGGTGGFGGRFSVRVDESHRRRAEDLYWKFRANPPVLEPGWEAQATPDLSRLAPGVRAPCPTCGADLARDASLAACPSCSAPVDVVAVLLDRYGPDVLAPCYSDDLHLTDDELRASAVSCGCGYSLAGLEGAGVCPECGQAYSKRDILRGLL